MHKQQEKIIDDFNQAIEEKNYELAAGIAQFSVGDESPNHMLSPRWKMYCLNFLYTYHIEQLIKHEQEENAQECQNHISGILDIAWKFKWYLDKLAEDLDCSLEEIANCNNKMQEIYQTFELSPAMVHKTLMLQSMIMGKPEQAKKHFEKWQNAEKDGSQDCPACEQAELVNYHCFTGQYSKALELAAPLLNGKLSCAEIPHIIYHSVIKSQLQKNDWQNAKRTLNKAIKTITREIKEFGYLLPELLQLKIELGEEKEAQQLFEQYLDYILHFCENSAYHYMKLAFVGAKFYPQYQEQAKELAQAYDERNGNQYYQSQFARLMQKPTLQ